MNDVGVFTRYGDCITMIVVPMLVFFVLWYMIKVCGSDGDAIVVGYAGAL